MLSDFKNTFWGKRSMSPGDALPPCSRLALKVSATASEQREIYLNPRKMNLNPRDINLKGFQGFYLQAKARFWPCLSYMSHIRHQKTLFGTRGRSTAMLKVSANQRLERIRHTEDSQGQILAFTLAMFKQRSRRTVPGGRRHVRGSVLSETGATGNIVA